MSKILIADDYKPLITLYSNWLTGGHDVIPAYNGREAVDSYREHNPDLVLMDVRMPIKGGDEAIREIIEMNPNAKIVAITAYPYTQDELGVEVVRKGFSKREFLNMVERKLRDGV